MCSGAECVCIHPFVPYGMMQHSDYSDAHPENVFEHYCMGVMTVPDGVGPLDHSHPEIVPLGTVFQDVQRNGLGEIPGP